MSGFEEKANFSGEGGISFADPLSGGLKPSSLNRAAEAALVFCFPHLVRASSSHLLQTKTPAKLGFSDEVLRRGRDSNPRYKFKLV